jgi:hypothetical protein
MLHEGMYEEHGPRIEDADVVGRSLPIPVRFALNVGLTRKIVEKERENLGGLERVGFEVDFGVTGVGFTGIILRRVGGMRLMLGVVS